MSIILKNGNVKSFKQTLNGPLEANSKLTLTLTPVSYTHLVRHIPDLPVWKRRKSRYILRQKEVPSQEWSFEKDRLE